MEMLFHYIELIQNYFMFDKVDSLIDRMKGHTLKTEMPNTISQSYKFENLGCFYHFFIWHTFNVNLGQSKIIQFSINIVFVFSFAPKMIFYRLEIIAQSLLQRFRFKI